MDGKEHKGPFREGHDMPPDAAASSSMCPQEPRPLSCVATRRCGDSCELSTASSDSCLPTSMATFQAETADQSDIQNWKRNTLPETDINDFEQAVIKDALETENDFMKYALSFPVRSHDYSSSQFVESKKSAADVVPKVGLDHLDNLCKLMEQLSELKEANVKLKRRVQYLEDLKCLQEIHQEMLHISTVRNSADSGGNFRPDHTKEIEPPPALSEESSSEAFAVPSIPPQAGGLQRSKTATHVGSKVDHPKPEGGHRSRNLTKEIVRERSKSVGHPDHSKSKNRSSRWSKVKVVLGIEKAHEDSHSSAGVKVSSESSKQVPHSAIEFSQHECGNWQCPVHATACNNKTRCASTTGSEEGLKKYPKSPWGKMKTIIQSRRVETRNQRGDTGSSSFRRCDTEDFPTDAYTNSQQNIRRASKASRKSSFSSQDIQKRRFQELQLPSNRSHTCERTDSLRVLQASGQTKCDHNAFDCEMCKTKKVPRANESQKVPESGRLKTPRANHIRNEDAKALLQSSSPRKDHSTGDDTQGLHIGRNIITGTSSACASTNRTLNSSSPSDMVFGSHSIPQSSEKGNQQSLPEMRSGATNTDAVGEQQSSRELQTTTPCTSATVTELLKELQHNLSEDFNRKLEEWHRFRSEAGKHLDTEIERKDSFGKLRKLSKPEKKYSATEKLGKHSNIVQKKDLHWLEKELQKVEREIVRLSKEKQKFEKRAVRLRCLKEAMNDSQMKNEVFVKTSAGEFRFHGISNAFTKKLYEWETKKGVGPELSTIALLDESLKTHELQPGECRSIADIGKRSTPSVSEHSERFAYNISKSSSEPDFSTLTASNKDSSSPKSAIRSQSGDTFLAFSNEAQFPDDKARGEEDSRPEAQISRLSSTELQHSREDYCSLLEENMFLLDQLKEKEYICTRLQNELDRLDEKAGKANMIHQEELEKYRQKLWEIHMSRPKDLQGSLHLISELKARIEELHKCSDILKSDREKLEESFHQQSEQQRTITNDLISRIKAMQESFTHSAQRGQGSRRKSKPFRTDETSTSRIHELSLKLLQQARNVEEALTERTRQVCHLRWELLLRDMSTVLLQAALHRVTYQGQQTSLVPTWDMKRLKFKGLKAWSIDSTERRQSEAAVTEEWLQERLKQLSLAPYKQWTNVDFDHEDMISTVQELEKEVIAINSSETGYSPQEDVENRCLNASAESEIADSDRYYDSCSAANSRSSSFSSGPGTGMRGSYSDTRLYQRSSSLSRRRNSSSSMSCVSGFEASESSSIHDSDRIHQLMRKRSFNLKSRRSNRWSSKENVSSTCSSRSSNLDDEIMLGRSRTYAGGEDSDDKETADKCERLDEAEEEEVFCTTESPPVRDWPSRCLITPMRVNVNPSGTACQLSGEDKYVSYQRISLPSALETRTSPKRSNAHKDAHEGDALFSSGDSDSNTSPTGKVAYSRADTYQCSFPSRESTSERHRVSESDNYQQTRVDSDFQYHGAAKESRFMTLKEEQLFADIRNLASSCQISHQKSSSGVGNDTKIDAPCHESSAADSRLSQTTESPEPNTYSKAIEATYRYKGTQGFGRKLKPRYRDPV